MAGIARSGFQAVANAVWSLVSLANRTVTAAGGSIASVTGAVGSVTGNVGGNVAGSVASVTGNVGGNVAGSVASVTGNVGGNVSGSVATVVDKTGYRAMRQIVKMVVSALGTINDGNTENVTISPALTDHSKAFIASITGLRHASTGGVYARISDNTTLEITNNSGASQAVEAFNVEIVEFY